MRACNTIPARLHKFGIIRHTNPIFFLTTPLTQLDDPMKVIAVPLFLAVISAMPTQAAPVPLAGNAPVPLNRLRVNNPAVLPMTGTWSIGWSGLMRNLSDIL